MQCAGNDEGVLKDITAWLIINTMRSEKVQFNMLCEQNLHTVWRKRAFNMLMGTCIGLWWVC